MLNSITDMANPEMVRNTPGKRGRATKATKSKRKSSQQQETQLPSGPEPIVGGSGQGFNFSPLQQSGTPILLTAARMAPVPGLGYLFQDWDICSRISTEYRCWCHTQCYRLSLDNRAFGLPTTKPLHLNPWQPQYQAPTCTVCLEAWELATSSI
jgi:hypothetical protein